MNANSDNRILKKLLERLFASLINGPSLNCRPHSSRQRIDFLQFARFRDRPPNEILRDLLGESRQARIAAKVPAPKPQPAFTAKTAPTAELEASPEEKAARDAHNAQQSVLTKLRSIAEDARTYENDTGVHVLQIGFPLLSLPPGAAGRMSLTRRILAPLTFVSLAMTVKGGPTPTTLLECRNEGADLVVPNQALLAWVEQQTGQAVGELFADETGAKPWAEIVVIAKRVCELLQIDLPPMFAGETWPEGFELAAAPRADGEESAKPLVIPAAVIGLFPMANQGLLRDMQALVGGEAVSGPIESFIRLDAALEPAPVAAEGERAVEKRARNFADERLVAQADPCQARAVKLARTARGLVVHGPPGTGKSQTITNVIGDSLARGERVLFVCDKRTALDVVMNRLEGLGLGALCAIVHDPQRDQRDLYRSVREQLDELSDLKSDASAESKLTRIDLELKKLHTELCEYHTALMVRPGADAPSFHELMGQWLALPDGAVELKDAFPEQATLTMVEDSAKDLSDIFDRAVQAGYPSNPWTAAAGLSLEDFLATPADDLRDRIRQLVAACESADASLDPAIPPLPPDGDIVAIATARARLGVRIAGVRSSVDPVTLAQWAAVEPRKIAQAEKKLREVSAHVVAVESGPLDAELLAAIDDAPPTMPRVAEQSAVLGGYIESTKSIFGFFAFGTKKAAAEALVKYGLHRTRANAERVQAFLAGVRARLMLKRATKPFAEDDEANGMADDDALVAAFRKNESVVALLSSVHNDPLLADVRATALQSLAAREEPAEFLRGLQATTRRTVAIGTLQSELGTPLFSDAFRKQLITAAREGEGLAKIAKTLDQQFDSLENVLRVKDGIDRLPKPLAAAATQAVKQRASGEAGLAAMCKAAVANDIGRRLRGNRLLMTADNKQLESSFDRYLQLDTEKMEFTRRSVLHRWATIQKQRLLAMTGSRLNGQGADLRRRLTIRGERAMRLRQVVAVGQGIDGGDPLFDLRPVWMASPETVAQVFPRKPIFDLVIFDEASQCRLEEALPVLLRANRVVIAGDPKQLPPTRFFESAVVASDDDEIESDQQLFESQQGEIEDLLAAALNLEIEESYLDVHYRSRNSDLIQFSNDNFYGARLQAIPGHPHNRTQFAPLTLYKVNGTYDERTNAAEAVKVCQIVADLLKRAEPPSIGIACFNIAQRDLIIEKLEDQAAADAEFGKSFAAARDRRTRGSAQGLFVKNLENVQGDERDHIIISTTYGPDPKGRFYRRFGPLGRSGGGRRLNVLVTRARDEVHLVTSIPEAIYRNVPAIPAGATPGGGWLLFSYLQYAENLAAIYEKTHEALERNFVARDPVATVRPSRFPSTFAEQLAERLRVDHRIGSEVHWGNDGFCIDLALQHPSRLDGVTTGVLCDMNRFEQAADPVEWEVFRTWILKGQGWSLTRLWTPHFFRDRRGNTERTVREHEAAIADAENPDAIRVVCPKSGDKL